MIRATSFAVAVVASCVMVCAMSGCREEPTIVIKFEPNDLSGAGGAKAATRDLSTVAVADLGTAAAPAKADKPGAPAKGGVAECKTAADCTLIPVECCGCNNGGGQQAVSKAKQHAAQAAQKSRCAKTMCPMMMSHDPSCAQLAACIGGTCTLAPLKKK
jgi:hypothetical protein